MSETNENRDCPCGNAIIRKGEVVKAHWTGKVCEECEAVMIQKFNDRLLFPRKSFFPDVTAVDAVQRVDLRNAPPLEGEADILFLRKGDRVQHWHVSHGGKSIVVVYIDRTDYSDV